MSIRLPFLLLSFTSDFWVFVQSENIKDTRISSLSISQHSHFPSNNCKVWYQISWGHVLCICTNRHVLNFFNANSGTLVFSSFYIQWRFLTWCHIPIFKTELPYLLSSHIIFDCMKQIYPVLLIGYFLLFVDFCYYKHCNTHLCAYFTSCVPIRSGGHMCRNLRQVDL